MAEDPYKNEEYTNLGGINTKASVYNTGQNDALNLVNFDLSVPGSLTKRPGSTQHMTGFTGPIVGLHEYNKVAGFSQLLAINQSFIVHEASNGYSPLLAAGYGATLPVAFSLISGNTFNSMLTFVDREFVAQGTSMFKYDGSFLSYWDVPVFDRNFPTGTNIIGATFYTDQAGAAPGNLGQSSIQYAVVGAAWMNDRGFIGQPYLQMQRFTYTSPIPAQIVQAWFVTIGKTLIPSGYGITAVAIYMSNLNSTAVDGAVGSSFPPGTDLLLNPAYFFTAIAIGSQAGNTFSVVYGTTLTQNGASPSYLPMDPRGVSYSFGAVANAFTFYKDTVFKPGYKPKYIDTYSNRLFMAGFRNINDVVPIDGVNNTVDYSSAPSIVWFSDLAEPEGIRPENFFEVRTNDGDKITGIKNYLNSLIIFKSKSFHELTGDNPDNFVLKEASDQYGCLSHKAAVVFENQLLFLDRKGICHWNGANVRIISSKIESIFTRMNVAGAFDTARAVHVKARNEVWFAIPVDGATTNNLIVVYDYLADAFTTFSGFVPSELTIAQNGLSSLRPFYGSYTNLISQVSASFLGDNGAGITCLVKTKYSADIGKSITKQFRRLFLDVDTVTGTTSPIQINFYQDYGASIVYGTTMYANQFQSRIDFGIPAKSLSAEMVHSSASLPIRINGYTIEYRDQRRV